jgi:hypothetical protein
LTLGATDFLCLANVAFFGTALRAIGFFVAFFGTAFLIRAFFLTAAFFVTLLFTVPLAFETALAVAVFRPSTFFATALFAFGRAVFEAATRLLVAALGAERRATVRDIERLKLFVTALISKVMIERTIWN